MFSCCPTLADAVSLVEQVGGSGTACVLVDPLHHERAGGRPDEVDGLPLDLVPYIQLCDIRPAGASVDAATARAEAVHGRLLPGAGDLPLRDLLAHLHPGTGISVESPLAGERRPADPAAWAACALAATRAVLIG